MDLTTGFFLLLVSMVSAGGAVGITYLILKRYFDHQMQLEQQALADRKRKDHLPLQMQAYERLILLLERLHPERLVFRTSKPGMSARMLQSDLKKIIREEFDHNLAQQLYISAESWQAVKAAREEIDNILNIAAEQVHRDADALSYSKAILEITAGLSKLPTEVAVEILKKEFRSKLKA